MRSARILLGALRLAILALFLSAPAHQAAAQGMTSVPGAVPVAMTNERVFLPLVAEGTGQPVETPQPGNDVPAEVVATWFEGQLLPLEFYDPNTGTWSSPSGKGQMYIFSANSYTYAAFARTQYGQCTGEVSVYQEGAARSEQETLLLTPSIYRTRTVTICGSRQESVVEGSHDTRTVPWSLGHDELGHPQLTLTDNGLTFTYLRDGMVAELVGTWHKGPVFSDNFYDPETATFVTPEGSGQWLRIQADGTFSAGEYSVGEVTDPQGCALTGWLYQEGSIEISGGRLTFTPAAGMMRLENECQPGQHQQEPWHDSAKSYSWGFRDYPDNPKLLIIPLEYYQEIELIRE
ncbi:MAG: hypothetical protein DCC55_10895 [Chloroflexi bacterium]|nr:MAG: hypothetical protein DCC55_10895 [Chloroflexota bacterium]